MSIKDKKSFSYNFRIRYSEVDAQKIVYNSHYLTFLDVSIFEFFNAIGFNQEKYIKDTNKLYSYCNKNIEGYKCFMVKKNIIKPILNFKRPESCFRIDDNYITESVNRLNIDIITVKYNNKYV